MTDHTHIGESIGNARRHLAAHPDEGAYRDRPATAVIEAGLRCRVEAPDGTSVVTDMPTSVGGGDTAPTPGWLTRAGQAGCEATVIAMRAAELGVPLERVEVTVDSESDDRGLLGVDDSVPPGPYGVRIAVTITSAADPAALQEIVHWADRHSPTSDALRRAVPVTVEVRTPAGATP